MDTEIRELPVDELVLDPGLNLRDRLDPETVERYAESWRRLPPVTVFEIDARWLMADGFHRHAAAVSIGRPTLAAEIRVGSYDDALDFVAGANLRHGLPLTRAERRRVVEVKLRLHADWSDRKLADELGLGRELIARVRKALVEAGQIPPLSGRLGSDGKTYPAVSAGLPKDPNERRPRDGASGRDDPRDRGAREADRAPWDDTTDPLAVVPPGGAGAPPFPGSIAPPWSDAPRGAAEPRDLAMAPPVEVATPSIEEMLAMMAGQVMQVVRWTQADGFQDAYRTAGANSRGVFQAAVLKLAARADQLRKG